MSISSFSQSFCSITYSFNDLRSKYEKEPYFHIKRILSEFSFKSAEPAACKFVQKCACSTRCWLMWVMLNERQLVSSHVKTELGCNLGCWVIVSWDGRIGCKKGFCYELYGFSSGSGDFFDVNRLK